MIARMLCVCRFCQERVRPLFFLLARSREIRLNAGEMIVSRRGGENTYIGDGRANPPSHSYETRGGGPAMADHKYISIRGAREHNLKNIDLDLPRDSLIVMTGLSGSGKSSLAFDTIYAEGQRRYVESLSAYARQFLEMMQKPDVDQIDGLSPAISIEQKTTSQNPRSTVGTVTEIYDYMRLLFARVGMPYSPATGLPIESQTVSQMVDRVLALPRKARGSTCWRRSCAAARASTARNSPSCRRRASSASRSTATSTRSPTRRRSTRSTSTTSTSWSTASSCARTSRRGSPTASRRRWSSPTASPSPNSPTGR